MRLIAVSRPYSSVQNINSVSRALARTNSDRLITLDHVLIGGLKGRLVTDITPTASEPVGSYPHSAAAVPWDRVRRDCLSRTTSAMDLT